MKNSLLMGNINQIIDNINQGWKSKKNLSRLVSNNNLDKIISNSLDLGAKAAKVSGAGGGGFIYFLVDLKNKNKLIEYLNSTKGKFITLNLLNQDQENGKLTYENYN